MGLAFGECFGEGNREAWSRRGRNLGFNGSDSMGLTPVEGEQIEWSWRLGSVSAREIARLGRGGAEIWGAPCAVLSDSGGLMREFRAHRSRILRLHGKRDENSGFSAHCERGCRASTF